MTMYIYIYIYYTYAYFNAPVYIGTLPTTALHASCCLEQVRPRSSGWCPGNRGDSRRLAPNEMGMGQNLSPYDWDISLV